MLTADINWINICGLIVTHNNKAWDETYMISGFFLRQFSFERG
jgi:hypothetical protein